MTLSKIIPSILGVCSVTFTFLAKVPSKPSINKANPNHKNAPTASLFKIAIIAKNPKTAPEPVNPCTAQAAILFLFNLSKFGNIKNLYHYIQKCLIILYLFEESNDILNYEYCN